MKEKIRRSTESITVGIMGGKVSSYRKKQEDTVTVRVYKDGYIGVAGAIGECDEKELEIKPRKCSTTGLSTRALRAKSS